MKPALAGALVAALLAGRTAAARADDGPALTTVSLEPRALSAHGLAIEAERDLPAHRASLAAALALRSTAGGDYASTTLGAGLELRYWLRRRAVWTHRPRGAAVGWYLAARIDVSRTALRDAMDTSLGAMTTVGTALLVGYRFAPWRGLEVRPYAGLAVRTDTGGDLPAWTRGSLGYGLALGWTF